MADQFLATYQGADFSVLVNKAAQAYKVKAPVSSSVAQVPSSNAKAPSSNAASTAKATEESAPWRAWRSLPPPEPPVAPKTRPVAKQPAVAVAKAPDPRSAAVPPIASPPLFAGSTVAPTAAFSEAPAAQATLPTAAQSGAPNVFYPAKRAMEEKDEEINYLKRRLRNTQRSGRNKVYYAMLNKYGADVARQYWVEPPESSSSSSASVPKQVAAKVPVPKPKETATGFREAL